MWYFISNLGWAHLLYHPCFMEFLSTGEKLFSLGLLCSMSDSLTKTNTHTHTHTHRKENKMGVIIDR